MVASCERGASVRKLAEKYGVNRNTVTRELKQRGITPRRTKLTPEKQAQLARRAAAGWNHQQLAEHFRVSVATVKRILSLERTS